MGNKQTTADMTINRCHQGHPSHACQLINGQEKNWEWLSAIQKDTSGCCFSARTKPQVLGSSASKWWYWLVSDACDAFLCQRGMELARHHTYTHLSPLAVKLCTYITPSPHPFFELPKMGSISWQDTYFPADRSIYLSPSAITFVLAIDYKCNQPGLRKCNKNLRESSPHHGTGGQWPRHNGCGKRDADTPGSTGLPSYMHPQLPPSIKMHARAALLEIISFDSRT